jgi:hypothetical protein
MADVEIQIQGDNEPEAQDVVASGSLVVFNNDTITFRISEGESVFTLQIQLKEDNSRGAGMTSTRTSTSAKITLVNFGAPGGVGLKTRVPVVFLGDEQVYLSYAVLAIAEVRIFSYTLSR